MNLVVCTVLEDQSRKKIEKYAGVIDLGNQSTTEFKDILYTLPNGENMMLNVSIITSTGYGNMYIHMDEKPVLQSLFTLIDTHRLLFRASNEYWIELLFST